MHGKVRPKNGGLGKAFPTYSASVGPLPSVFSHVDFQGLLFCKSSFTLVTSPWFNSRMCLDMPFQVALSREPRITQVTTKWFLSRMSPPVYHQITLASKSLLTPFTLEWFCMLPTMTSEASSSDMSFSTEFTLVNHFIGTIWTTPGNPVNGLVHWCRVPIDSNTFHARHS